MALVSLFSMSNLQALIEAINVQAAMSHMHLEQVPQLPSSTWMELNYALNTGRPASPTGQPGHPC